MTNTKSDIPTLNLRKGEILTEQELDDGVHAVQLYALARGMIPIAGIISRPMSDGRHEILGFGHNELADGVPGVHGETGAVKNMGRISGGYGDLVATSSLSPCPFCQCTLARHMGIKTVRILDDRNYRPDKSDYEKVGIKPVIKSHPRIEETFARWVNDSTNAVLWSRDIGIASGPKRSPRAFTREEIRAHTDRACRLAKEGRAAGEAPIGAVIVDDLGQVVGAGYSLIATENDPSKVAAMTAWRNAGSRDDWGRCTLVLSCGPDNIAYSMFKVFNFGQLLVASQDVFAGKLEEVRALGKGVVVDNNFSADSSLGDWITEAELGVVQEYLGADYKRQ